MTSVSIFWWLLREGQYRQIYMSLEAVLKPKGHPTQYQQSVSNEVASEWVSLVWELTQRNTDLFNKFISFPEQDKLWLNVFWMIFKMFYAYSTDNPLNHLNHYTNRVKMPPLLQISPKGWKMMDTGKGLTAITFYKLWEKKKEGKSSSLSLQLSCFLNQSKKIKF